MKGRTVLPGMIDTHSHMHDHTIQLWTKNHPKEVDTVVKRFSVGGKTFQDLTHGIEVVVKDTLCCVTVVVCNSADQCRVLERVHICPMPILAYLHFIYA